MQERLSQKIPGFKFNLGFSGRSFKQGDEEEDEGDNALLEHALQRDSNPWPLR